MITGKERNIVASMSYEAKARGVVRAMRLSEVRKLCPDAVFLPSDYETYSLLSKRFFSIVRRYTPDVEEYGIDECFADITGMQRPLRMGYRAHRRGHEGGAGRGLRLHLLHRARAQQDHRQDRLEVEEAVGADGHPRA